MQGFKIIFSINTLHLFKCFGLHCCEKIGPKVVSDTKDFRVLEGIWCLKTMVVQLAKKNDNFLAPVPLIIISNVDF